MTGRRSLCSRLWFVATFDLRPVLLSNLKLARIVKLAKADGIMTFVQDYFQIR